MIYSIYTYYLYTHTHTYNVLLRTHKALHAGVWSMNIWTTSSCNILVPSECSHPDHFYLMIEFCYVWPALWFVR